MTEVLPLVLVAHVAGRTLHDMAAGVMSLAQRAGAQRDLDASTAHWAVTQGQVLRNQTYAQARQLADATAFPPGGVNLVLTAPAPRDLAAALSIIGDALVPGLDLSGSPLRGAYALTCVHTPHEVFAQTLTASVTADTQEGVVDGLYDLALAVEQGLPIGGNSERSVTGTVQAQVRLADAEAALNTEVPADSSKVTLVLGAGDVMGLGLAVRRAAYGLSRQGASTEIARQWVGAAFCQRLIYHA